MGIGSINLHKCNFLQFSAIFDFTSGSQSIGAHDLSQDLKVLSGTISMLRISLRNVVLPQEHVSCTALGGGLQTCIYDRRPFSTQMGTSYTNMQLRRWYNICTIYREPSSESSSPC